MPKSHLMNANIHRAKEGVRVLEDIARFILRDKKLFDQARNIRHRIQMSAPIYDIKEDLGGVCMIEKNGRSHLIDVIQANALRLQEALRVLEEMTPSSSEKHLMKEIRYQSYDLHSNIYYAVSRYVKLQSLTGLYLIVDTDVIPHPMEYIVDIINQSSVNIVQYRNKSGSKRSIFDGAYKIKQLLDPNKLFIINDHIDIALDLGNGVHIGQNDYPLERVRNIIPDDFIFGISCHNIEEAHTASQCGVSYIAMGCLFETNSKKDVTPVSIRELQSVCKEISMPVCAIGGINNNNLVETLTADIKMAALISYVWKHDDPLLTINGMHEKIIMKNRPFGP